MSATVEKIDSLIGFIDESKNNSDGQLAILGLGNPLLDISSPVNDAFMKKYDIKAGNAILAEDKHLPMYQELADMSTVEYIGGGSTLNSMRVSRWMSQQSGFSGYMGCIGKDKFGQVLEDATKEAGVECNFMIDEKTATGTCAVCLTGKERSLVANLAAANNFKIAHCSTEKAKRMIASAKFIYSAGFFLTVSVDTMLMCAKQCKEENKPYGLNLSAPFITSVFKDQLLSVLPFVQVLFTNEDEAKAFAEANKIQFGSMSELAVQISKLKCELKKARTVIITQGSDPVIVATNDQVKEYAVEKIPKEKIVDLNGAGDAFVGGFLSQYVNGADEAVCVSAGNYAAQYVIQRAGTKLEGKPAFDGKSNK
eukprot:CAMPEP_0202686208 /NCGR_PEP_ID=MMETSP1385-20130828/2016_1 /ASSEMBLY_ACC=CAM_ASM_000861 /TAXON_ID=933848 /ORGANISM="Elphidium margaritaceum" /LENGTH=366 /DNA_ID=CAMNT_0049340739 /DNA_START=40 /DNA_END=1140 /DNA_ORIENTATION=+